jgi:hypothetical protein
VPVQGVLEVPLDIDFVLPINGKCTSLGPGDTLPVPVTLTMFYNQDTIDRLKIREPPINIDEGNLRILHYDRNANEWSEVGVAGRDPELDWIATEPVQEAGIYAIAWVAATPPGKGP